MNVLPWRCRQVPVKVAEVANPLSWLCALSLSIGEGLAAGHSMQGWHLPLRSWRTCWIHFKEQIWCSLSSQCYPATRGVGPSSASVMADQFPGGSVPLTVPSTASPFRRLGGGELQQGGEMGWNGPKEAGWQPLGGCIHERFVNCFILPGSSRRGLCGWLDVVWI